MRVVNSMAAKKTDDSGGPPPPSESNQQESTSKVCPRPAQAEVNVAVQFLTDLVKTRCKGLVNSGSGDSVLNDASLEKLTTEMSKVLLSHYEKHWFPGQPLRGMAYRCVRINGKLDPLLVKAGKNVGMEHSTLKVYFPSELTIWIDPGHVSYRIGEDGSICDLYRDPNAKSIHPSAVQGKSSGACPRKSGSSARKSGTTTGATRMSQNGSPPPSSLVHSAQVHHNNSLQLLPVVSQSSALVPVSTNSGAVLCKANSGPIVPHHQPPVSSQHQIGVRTSPVPLLSASPSSDSYISSSGSGSSFGSSNSGHHNIHHSSLPRGSPPLQPPPPLVDPSRSFSRGLSVGSLGVSSNTTTPPSNNAEQNVDWAALLTTASLLASQQQGVSESGTLSDVRRGMSSPHNQTGHHQLQPNLHGAPSMQPPVSQPQAGRPLAPTGGAAHHPPSLHPSASYPNFHQPYGQPPPGHHVRPYPPGSPQRDMAWPQSGAQKYGSSGYHSPNGGLSQGPGFSPPPPSGPPHVHTMNLPSYHHPQAQQGQSNNSYHHQQSQGYHGAPHGGPWYQPEHSHMVRESNSMEFCKDNLERLVEYMNIPIASMGSG